MSDGRRHVYCCRPVTKSVLSTRCSSRLASGTHTQCARSAFLGGTGRTIPWPTCDTNKTANKIRRYGVVPRPLLGGWRNQCVFGRNVMPYFYRYHFIGNRTPLRLSTPLERSGSTHECIREATISRSTRVARVVARSRTNAPLAEDEAHRVCQALSRDSLMFCFFPSPSSFVTRLTSASSLAVNSDPGLLCRLFPFPPPPKPDDRERALRLLRRV